MTNQQRRDSVLGQLTDGLKLQAHLAKMEATNPSGQALGLHREASALAQMRDTLRVQIHLGQLEAKDEWNNAEDRWRTFVQRDLTPATKTVATAAEQAAHDLLHEIREAYHVLLGR